MRIGKVSTFTLLLISTILSGCSKNAEYSNITNMIKDELDDIDDSIVTLEEIDFKHIPTEHIIELPYYVNLDKKDWLEVSYTPSVYDNWETNIVGYGTVDYNNILVDERTTVLKRAPNRKASSADIYAGGGQAPSLYIGNNSWEDYSFSFDFFFGNGSYIEFAIYNDSSILDYAEDSIQHFFFRLDKTGFSFQTTFGVNSFFYENIKPNFDFKTWNNIMLVPVGKELQLYVNGIYYGSLYEYNDLKKGAVALSSDVGCAFKDIKIEKTTDESYNYH